jgi:hypothetical protein
MKPRKSFTALEVSVSERSGREISLTFKDSHVPLSMRVTINGTIIATEFKDAEYVLIDRIDEKANANSIIYDYYGVSVNAMIIQGVDASYVYYKVEQDIKPVDNNILVILSRHFLGSFSGYYNDWCSNDNVFIDLGQAVNLIRHKINSLEQLPAPKISGEHHLHFNAVEVYQSLDDEEKRRANHALRLPQDATTTMMAGVMLWLASLEDELFIYIVTSDLLDAKDTAQFIRSAKKLSVQAKSLQNLVHSDLRKVFEVDVLVNRSFGEVDWQGEKNNRLKPKLANIPLADIYNIVYNLFTKDDVNRERPKKMSWDNYWAARWQWSAAGSIHSQYPEDLASVPKDRELKNKFIALAIAEDVPIDHFLMRKPSVHAWSSVKYEWGKMRAIYGTDYTSYIMAHFAFYNCEDVLPSDFPVGNKARPSFVSARVAAVLDGTIPLCIDYEDFNSQHSNAAMRTVMQAYIDAFSGTLSDEQLKAAHWTMDSIDETIVHDNMGTGTTYRGQGTLMSGWRLTTFMNSVLNYVYTRKILGGLTTTNRSIHNGDDVLVGCHSLQVAQRAVRGAAEYGVRLQRAKCAFGGLAEFLRVDHMRGETGQYLTRNIATMMHSRIESKKAVSPIDQVQAMEERFREFLQRGGAPMTIISLRKTYYQTTARLAGMHVNQLKVIKQSHAVVGGISEREDAMIRFKIIKDDTPVESTLPDHMPGVNAYAMALRKTLDLNVSPEKIISRIKKATLNAVQLVRRKIFFVENDNEQRYKVLRAIYKAYKDAAATPLFGKAMLVGFIFDVLARGHQTSALSYLLNNSKDPMELLRVLV